MYYLKSALKVITYIFIGIVLMLFFLFVLTYDFKEIPKKEFVDKQEVKTSLIERINNAANEKNDFNEVNIKLGEKLTNQLLSYAVELNNIKKTYESKYWTLKEINFDIDDNKLCLTINAEYHDVLKYQLEIKTYFDVYVFDDTIELVFNKFKIGSIIIPDKLVSLILKRSNEYTIGDLFSNTLDSLTIIRPDLDNLKLIIDKDDLVYVFKEATPAEFLFGENEQTKITGGIYFSYLLKNNYIDLSIDDGINIKVDLSKIKNKEEENFIYNFDNEIEEIAQNKGGTLCDPSIIVYKNTKALFESNSTAALKYKYTKLQVNDEYMYLKFGFNFLGSNSILEYKIFRNDNKYIIEDVTIGKDDKEESSYARVSISDSLYILDSLNINNNKETNEISIEDLFYIEGLTLSNISISSDNVILSYQD